jgi:tellurite methyltransferase
MKSDKQRWNDKYRLKESPDFTPDPFLIEHEGLLTGGLALDVACGFGGNSLFAAAHGYETHATDVSFAALDALSSEASRRGLPVRCIVADLDEYTLPVGFYDLVMVFRFHSEERLRDALSSSLKPGGLLFYATYNYRYTSSKPNFNPDYLIPPGGLARFFPGLSVIIDEPETGPDGVMSRLAARKDTEKI